MSEGKRLDRRGFLTVAAGATAAGGIATLPGEARAQEMAWDREVDVVIVGYGGAGAAAAITAHDAGARVLLLEKTASGGGSTLFSGGFFVSPADAQGSADYLLYCARAADGEHFDMERDDLVAWSEEAMANVDWFRGLGGDPAPSLRGWFEVPGAESFVTYQPREDATGTGIWTVLSAAVAQRGIEVVYEAAVQELVTREVADGEGPARTEVLGVVAALPAGRLAVRAARAVILTCGGFDYDEKMKAGYLRSYPVHSVGHLGNTGDAIRLAAKTGAALWHLTATSANICHKLPDVAVAFPSALQLGATGSSVIMVDRLGRRYVDESLNYDIVARSSEGYDGVRRGFMANPCWLLFDEKTRTAGPAGLPVPIGHATYTWSPDNSEEIARGYILKADSIADLAAQMEVDAETLSATVERYNAHCAAGSDPDFGRKHGLIAVEGPPFYALKGSIGLWATGGGPRINRQAQVLDGHGRVVPRLYVAGSASAFCFSYLYPLSGTAIGDCFAMGRIAGRGATAETAW